MKYDICRYDVTGKIVTVKTVEDASFARDFAKRLERFTGIRHDVLKHLDDGSRSIIPLNV